MSTQTFAAMRSKLMAALAKIGATNGHACPQTDSNIDPIMHEYLVSTDAESFFKKRRDKAKKALLAIVDGDELSDALARVTKNDAGENGVPLATGALYRVEADIKRPAQRFDQTKLRSELMREGKTPEEVETLIDKCTKSSAPSITYKVVAA